MKRNIVYILTLIFCIILILLLSSCNEQNFFQETAAQTEKAELKEFADPALISEIKEGMTKEELENLLGAYSVEIRGNFTHYYAYRFTDGSVAYVTFRDYVVTNPKEAQIIDFQIGRSIDPAFAESVKVGDTTTDISELFGEEGVMLTNMYGNNGYILTDGRVLEVSSSRYKKEGGGVGVVITKIEIH